MISGRTRKELKRLIKTGAIVRQRPKGGKVSVAIPQIDIPHFVFGDTGEGIKRGPGKEGDIIGRDPQPGQGNQAGDTPGDGINIQIDMDEVLKFMQEELKLPEMKPKPNETFEEVKIKYNNISKIGVNSLRHLRRTMKEAMKRMAMMGDLNTMHVLPGADVPMRLISPIKSDFRFRQFREIKIPSSNAVIFFARDCSGSMDDAKCDIVSDMAWWIDCWIRKYYEKVDRCYFIHDTAAEEVNEEKFYSYRMGGGTKCSSVFEEISEQLVNRYPPDKYNVYLFYFTDGDNFGEEDNAKMIKTIQEKMGPVVVNMIGITQICSYRYEDTVKHHIDKALTDGKLDKSQVRTAYVGHKGGGDAYTGMASSGGALAEDDRNQQIIEAIRKLLAPAPAGR